MNILGLNVTRITRFGNRLGLIRLVPGESITQLEPSKSIRPFVLRYNPVVMGLVDTRRSRLTEETVKGCLKKEENLSWVDVPKSFFKDKKSGGIMFAWNELYFTISKTLPNKRWLLVEGNLIKERIDVSFLLVSEPSCRKERDNLRSDLLNLGKTISNPLVVMGKFYDGVPTDLKDADFQYFVDHKFSKHFKVKGMLGSGRVLSGQRPLVLHCNEQDDI